jgi:hypothetical protein
MSDQRVVRLEQVLRLLASPAEDQLAYARRIGVGNDEMALEFDDIAGARHTLLSNGVLSAAQAEAIAAVAKRLNGITTAGPSRWGDAAIRSGEDWEELRGLAKQAVDLLSRATGHLPN